MFYPEERIVFVRKTGKSRNSNLRCRRQCNRRRQGWGGEEKFFCFLSSDERGLSKTSSYKITGSKQSDCDIGLVGPQSSFSFYGDYHQRVQDSSERKGENIYDNVQNKANSNKERRFFLSSPQDNIELTFVLHQFSRVHDG